MIYTYIIISNLKIDQFQRDFLIKSGFSIVNMDLVKSIRSSELHIILNQISSKKIPFSMKSLPSNNSTATCKTCKR